MIRSHFILQLRSALAAKLTVYKTEEKKNIKVPMEERARRRAEMINRAKARKAREEAKAKNVNGNEQERKRDFDDSSSDTSDADTSSSSSSSSSDDSEDLVESDREDEDVVAEHDQAPVENAEAVNDGEMKEKPQEVVIEDANDRHDVHDEKTEPEEVVLTVTQGRKKRNRRASQKSRDIDYLRSDMFGSSSDGKKSRKKK